jgi:hypothetical protein
MTGYDKPPKPQTGKGCSKGAMVGVGDRRETIIDGPARVIPTHILRAQVAQGPTKVDSFRGRHLVSSEKNK